MSRKDLARALGVTVHAVGMVITGAGGKERWLSRENHLAAAKILNVDPNWLMTGADNKAQVPIAMQLTPAELSPSAMELAWLFDQIPLSDRLRRVIAYNNATQQILNVLQELHDEPPTGAPVSAAGVKKRSSKAP